MLINGRKETKQRGEQRRGKIRKEKREAFKRGRGWVRAGGREGG
jgi:hypothetical protein